MAYLPVALNLNDRRIVIIGGGKVALQKVKSLLKYEATIILYASTILEDLLDLPISCFEEPYSSKFLREADIVYATTDSREVNSAIATDARSIGALVNVVDDPSNCDFVSAAIFAQDDISVAVTSNGKNVKKSVAIRNQIRNQIRDLLE